MKNFICGVLAFVAGAYCIQKATCLFLDYDLNEGNLDEFFLRNMKKRGAIKLPVRCKDCKYFERDIMNAGFGTCYHPDWVQGNVGFEVDADGYCYRGETLL